MSKNINKIILTDVLNTANRMLKSRPIETLALGIIKELVNITFEIDELIKKIDKIK